MSTSKNLWQGLSPDAQKALKSRNYDDGSFGKRVSTIGVDVSDLIAADRDNAEVSSFWIPGVEVFSRVIHPQRHRGAFGELVRQDEGVLGKIKLWPVQWSTARMFAQSAKGFHVHPPQIPAGTTAADWNGKLFVDEAENYSLRAYDREQWDVIFFVQGVADMILCDIRDGLPRRVMRFFVDGDNHRGVNNAGVVVPPGVAHAIRTEGSEDLIMVYGTSTTFHPEFEGRIASELETSALPESWQKFLSL